MAAMVSPYCRTQLLRSYPASVVDEAEARHGHDDPVMNIGGWPPLNSQYYWCARRFWYLTFDARLVLAEVTGKSVYQWCTGSTCLQKPLSIDIDIWSTGCSIIACHAPRKRCQWCCGRAVLDVPLQAPTFVLNATPMHRKCGVRLA